MIRGIGTITLHVSNTDAAVTFFTEVLGFDKLMDMPMGPDARWVTVAPPGENTQIVLAANFAENSSAKLGSATGIVFNTDDMDATYADLAAKGVKFTEEPTKQSWGGILAQFEDPDGNEFVLVQVPKW